MTATVNSTVRKIGTNKKKNELFRPQFLIELRKEGPFFSQATLKCLEKCFDGLSEERKKRIKNGPGLLKTFVTFLSQFKVIRKIYFFAVVERGLGMSWSGISSSISYCRKIHTLAPQFSLTDLQFNLIA